MIILERGDKGPEVKFLQESLIKAGIHVLTDGDFGPGTEKAVKKFQKETGLLEDGIVGPQTMRHLDNFDSNTDTDSLMIEEIASKEGIEAASLKAIFHVEANGSGFQKDGRVKILFEAHIMYKQLRDHFKNVDLVQALKNHPNVVSKTWNASLYGKFSAQYDRFNEASGIQRLAAMKSTSYGAFQLMGFNHKICGFDNVEDFVVAMESGMYEQLTAAVKFLKSNKLDVHLKNHDWAKFARGYNGPGYAQNEYDIKLEKAYNTYS
tara:strand:+ start:9084 stop:9875 length:792 start_codon:yes stop_codon:yes gene_type:complete